MQVALFSDLHLEHSLAPLYKMQQGLGESCPDVVILAGDITTTYHKDVLRYIREMTNARIIYVPGNHEFYGTSIEAGMFTLRNECEKLGITFAVNEIVTVDDVSFVCSVGWSDLCSFSHLDMENKIERLSMISDFRMIQDHSVCDMMNLAETDRRFLNSALKCVADIGTIPVIVTHFSPFESCRNPRFDVTEIASYFSNNWMNILENAPTTPAAWLYGHTHSNIHDIVCGVPVFSNQCGYPGENVPGFDPKFVFGV